MVQILFKILIKRHFLNIPTPKFFYLTGIGLNDYFGFNLEFYLP